MNKNSSGSNHSSTHSLTLASNFVLQTEPSKESSHNTGQRKSMIVESESGRKKQNARMHSSSVQESSSGIPNIQSIMNSSVIYTATEVAEEKFFDTSLNASLNHTGTQMNQLLTNSKPIMPPMSKVIPKKLTINASKILYPI